MEKFLAITCVSLAIGLVSVIIFYVACSVAERASRLVSCLARLSEAERQEKEFLKALKPGSKWYLKNDTGADNPFAGTGPLTATVLEVRENYRGEVWIKYESSNEEGSVKTRPAVWFRQEYEALRKSTNKKKGNG